MSTELIVAGLFELGKLGLATYFQYCRMAGKTEEEIDKIYQEERAKFYANEPSKLPDV